LAIQGVEFDKDYNASIVKVMRIGNIPVPLHLVVTYNDGTSESFHQTAATWKDDETFVEIRGAAGKTVSSAQLGGTTIPDVDLSNNVYPRKPKK